MVGPERPSREFRIISGYYVVSDSTGYEPYPDITAADRWLHPGNADTGGARVDTGTFTGRVDVQVEVLSQPPEPEPDGVWEETEQQQLVAIGTTIGVYESEGEDRGLDRLTINPGQTYQLRVHARGRDIAKTFVTGPDTPVEHHLVQLWLN